MIHVNGLPKREADGGWSKKPPFKGTLVGPVEFKSGLRMQCGMTPVLAMLLVERLLSVINDHLATKDYKDTVRIPCLCCGKCRRAYAFVFVCATALHTVDGLYCAAQAVLSAFGSSGRL